MTFSYLAAFNWWLLLCPATLSHDWQMGSVPLVTSLSDSRNVITCLFLGLAILLAVRSMADFEVYTILFCEGRTPRWDVGLVWRCAVNFGGGAVWGSQTLTCVFWYRRTWDWVVEGIEFFYSVSFSRIKPNATKFYIQDRTKVSKKPYRFGSVSMLSLMAFKVAVMFLEV